MRSICVQADPTGQIWQMASAFRLVTLFFFYRLPVSETTTSNEKAASRGIVLFEKQ